MYTPCSVVAGRVSATGPVVEEQLHVASTADDDESNVVIVVIDVIDLLFAVYPELGQHALLVMVDRVAVWYSVFVGQMTVVQSSFGSMYMCE